MSKTRNLVNASLCLAAAIVLPFLTGQIPQIGAMLSPMHIPILICGFLCGPRYGLIIGFTAPLLRMVTFGMPQMPTALAMAFELATYGLVVGLIYRYLKKSLVNLYLALCTAMITGRVVWGIVMYIIAISRNTSFTWELFLAGALFNAIPGIILHLLLIPGFIVALQKAGYLHEGNN